MDTDNAGMSDQGGKDVEVEAISNPEETDAGKDRGDYGPWMLVERKKHAAKSWAARSYPLKPNPEQISALNAKD